MEPTLIEKRSALLEEMKAMDTLAKEEKRSFTEEEKTSFEEKRDAIAELDKAIEEEKRAEALKGFSETLPKVQETNPMENQEERAKAFAENGTLTTRAILSTGTIAKPTAVGGINGLGEVADSIVDDVHAVALTGNGAWVVAYKTADATAASVTDGSNVGGTGATFDTVSISPSEWGVFDTVSRQVKKMTPLNYLNEVERSALIGLRAEAAKRIVAAVKGSDILETRNSVALDATYIRNLVLNYRSIAGKGSVKLYISQGDLATLGAVRGTSEKKAVYEISFNAGTTTSGIIRDGGTAVEFRVLDSLTDGEQLFGQPGNIDMPMWDNYEVATDEGGDFFKKNLIAVRGIQTANADLVAYHGMQLIAQAAKA